MCKSGLQIHNPQAARVLDTSAMSISAGIILREFDLDPCRAAEDAEKMTERVTEPSKAANYAAVWKKLRALASGDHASNRSDSYTETRDAHAELISAGIRMMVGITGESTATCEWYEGIPEDAAGESQAALLKVQGQL